MSSMTQSADLLNGRYQPLREIGRGAQGRTTLARDAHTGREVVLKELDLGFIDGVDLLKLFERETRVLKSLEHPDIPSYLDDFEQVSADGNIARFFLVQEYIPGENLRDLIRSGHQFDEASVRDFLTQMLSILEYLHAQKPPILHRDIKPSNIVFRPDRRRYALVDFGGVQQRLLNAHGGSTVVGTSGYVPLEQLMGHARPASDLYALGATAVFLLSRRTPAEMLQPDGAGLNFREYIRCSDELADFLAYLLNPVAEDRPRSSTEAREALKNPNSRALAPRLDGALALLDADSHLLSRAEIIGLSHPPRRPRAKLTRRENFLSIGLSRELPNVVYHLLGMLGALTISAAIGFILRASYLDVFKEGRQLWPVILTSILLVPIIGYIAYLGLRMGREAGRKFLKSRITVSGGWLSTASRLDPVELRVSRAKFRLDEIDQLSILAIEVPAPPPSKLAVKKATQPDAAEEAEEEPTTQQRYMMEFRTRSGETALVREDLPLDEQFYLMGELYAFIEQQKELSK